MHQVQCRLLASMRELTTLSQTPQLPWTHGKGMNRVVRKDKKKGKQREGKEEMEEQGVVRGRDEKHLVLRFKTSFMSLCTCLMKYVS